MCLSFITAIFRFFKVVASDNDFFFQREKRRRQFYFRFCVYQPCRRFFSRCSFFSSAPQTLKVRHTRGPCRKSCVEVITWLNTQNTNTSLFLWCKFNPLHSGPMIFSSNQPLFIFWCAINTWTTVIPDLKNDGAHGVLKIINSFTHLKMNWIVSYACAGSCCAFLLDKFKIG